jgi:predicted MPP superfamily phosphohydrolase
MEIAFPELPHALDGFTLAHISDLHVGRFTQGKVLEKIVATANDLHADLAVFTGDLINYSIEDLPAGLDVLRSIRTRHGLFAVEGNHDLFVNARAFRNQTSKTLPLLVDESETLSVSNAQLQILGMRWAIEHPHSPNHPTFDSSARTLISQLRSGAFPILLAHHPHAFDHLDSIPLTLSGHTHGGQLMLNERIGMGPVAFRYWSGLYRKDNRAIVVSNGIGNWFPIRTQAPAELVKITLRRAALPQTPPASPSA